MQVRQRLTLQPLRPSSRQGGCAPTPPTEADPGMLHVLEAPPSTSSCVRYAHPPQERAAHLR
eukprot:15446325-Alexandrium_andersonii.AAC.1